MPLLNHEPTIDSSVTERLPLGSAVVEMVIGTDILTVSHHLPVLAEQSRKSMDAKSQRLRGKDNRSSHHTHQNLNNHKNCSIVHSQQHSSKNHRKPPHVHTTYTSNPSSPERSTLSSRKALDSPSRPST